MHHFGWALLVAVLPTARPEGLGISALLIAFYVCYRMRRHFRRVDSATLAVALVALASYYVWRIRVFGYWAPNAYYAKLSESRIAEIADGLSFVRHHVTESIPVAFGIALIVLSPIWATNRKWDATRPRATALIATWCGLAAIFMVVWSGGDSYEGSPRFLALPLVLLPLSLAMGASFSSGVIQRLVFGALVLLALTNVLESTVEIARTHRNPQEGFPTLRKYRQITERWARVAEALHAAAPTATIAESDTQYLRFFARGHRVLDYSGLNHAEIAHIPRSGTVKWGKLALDWAIRAQPDIIFIDRDIVRPGPRCAERRPSVLSKDIVEWILWSLSGRTLTETRWIELLYERYRPACLAIPDLRGHLAFLIRERFWRQLSPASGIVVGAAWIEEEQQQVIRRIERMIRRDDEAR
jgi:hypothetical protein